jgi:signal transduction histidine kinase/DNA-binding response OmpR family regulator/ligand-binding sensor domain-containing protein
LTKFRITALIIFIFGQVTFAQLNPNNLVQFNEKDGLPGAEIEEVLQDHLGYIWIPTLGGLVRYNGYEFKRYLFNPNDSTTIHSSIICSIFEDSKKNIWIGSTNNIEVYKPDKKEFKNFNKVGAEYDVLPWVSSIAEGFDGRIYFGVAENKLAVLPNNFSGMTDGLLYYDDRDESIKKYHSRDSLVIKSVYSLASDKKDNIWVLASNGLFKIDKNNSLSRVFDTNNKIIKVANRYRDIKFDGMGVLWITGDNSKFYSVDPRTEKIVSYSLNGLFKGFDNKLATYSIAIDKSNNIWLGSEMGLIFYNRVKKEYKIFKDESTKQIERVAIYGLKFDSFGSLWMGTQTSGLLKYDERTLFQSYSFSKDNENSLTNGWANRIIEGKNGKIWIITSGTTLPFIGINEFDPLTKSIRLWILQNILPDSHDLFGIHQLSEHELYLSTDLGLYLFSPNTNSVNKITLSGVPENVNINDFYDDNRGNLWLCTSEGIYKKVKEDNKFINYNLDYTDNSNSGWNKVSRVIESKNRGLWFTTDNGLFQYNYKSDNLVRHGFNINTGDVFLSQTINSFYEDNDGIAWVGTWQGGFSKYDPETGSIKSYIVDDGLPSMSIQGILGDEENNTLWLSTFDGLVRFDKKSEKFSSFSMTDGIQSQLFANGSYLKTSKGLFIFGGSNGITVFNPNDIIRNSIPPKVFLTDLRLSDKSVLPGKDSILEKPIDETDVITLEHDNNNISLEFIALHYLDPSKNQYAYMLENYDKGWRYVGNQHIAYYPNLPPGEYVFRVKASNNHDLWNEEGATIKIIINPPWWKTWWAYSFYMLFSLALIYFLRRYEMNRIRLQNQVKIEETKRKEREHVDQMKSTFFANISHEFRTPLTLILGPLTKLAAKNFPEEDKHSLRIMQRNAGRLLRLINQLLDFSKLESGKLNLQASEGDIVSFIKGLLVSFQSLAEQKHITYHFTSDQKSIELYFDRDKTEKIFTNLISNAFKFTPAHGEITVSISKKEHEVKISVKDTGQGISAEKLPHIFDRFYQADDSLTRNQEGSGIGLALTKELVELHQGRIEVTSKPNHGSEFLITLPVGKEHLTEEQIVAEDTILSDEPTKLTELAILDSEVQSFDKQETDSETIVLVVEDNPDMRSYIRETLHPAYKVVEAFDGAEGVECAREIVPDLIISDLMMPKKDGYQLCNEIKQDEATSHIPVILLTAKAERKDKLAGLQLGADDYLIKPFDSQELQIRVKNLIKIRRKLQVLFKNGNVNLREEKLLNPVDQRFMERVIAIISDNFADEQFDVQQFSREIGMSGTQLRRKMNALTGQSPNQFIRSKRLKEAARLIREEQQTVSEAAYQSGFNSLSYFSKCFQEEFGKLPSEY